MSAKSVKAKEPNEKYRINPVNTWKDARKGFHRRNGAKDVSGRKCSEDSLKTRSAPHTRMTEVDFIEKLRERNIEAETDDNGVVTMLLSETEFRKNRKYEKIVAQIGWERSWGKRIVK